MLLALITTLCGMLWRVWHGNGARLFGLGRVVRIPIGAILGGIIGYMVAPLWGAALGAAMIMQFVIGRTKWEDPIWMAVRFGLLPMVVVVAYWLLYGGTWGGMAFVGVNILAATSYVPLGLVDKHLPRFGWVHGSTTYAEALLGAAAFGGMWLLPLWPF